MSQDRAVTLKVIDLPPTTPIPWFKLMLLKQHVLMQICQFLVVQNLSWLRRGGGVGHLEVVLLHIICVLASNSNRNLHQIYANHIK